MVVFLNDKFCNEDEAFVPFKNRGMYFGEGIFETMRAYNGKVFAIEQHLQRLFSSAKYFSLPISFSISELNEIVHLLLLKNNLSEAIVRITLSGGGVEQGKHFSGNASNSIFFIEAKEFQPTFNETVSVRFAKKQLAHYDELRKHKTINYLRNILALREQENVNPKETETLFLDEHNFLLEGTRTNIFLVLGETIVTPSLDCDILPGITRANIKEICFHHDIPFEERIIHRSALDIASEMFVTNSLAEIVMISTLEHRTFTSNVMTTKLTTFYKEKILSECYPR